MSADNAPTPYALGDAPAPAVFPEPAEATVTGLETHTGTDPYGRAIGPAEDHTVPKLDSEGLTAEQTKPRKRGAK